MAQYVSGTAAMTSTNIIAENFDGCRSMLLPGTFDNFDFDKPVDIVINHDLNRKIGSTNDNSRLWMDGSKLKFSCLLKNTAAATQFLADHKAGHLRGCSINVSGFSEIRFDRNRRPYTAMMQAIGIADLGPVTSPADPFCFGIQITDFCPAPRRAMVAVAKPVARMTASVANRSGGKRPKKLMNCPPPPQSYWNGLAIMNAATEGSGVQIGAITLSAQSVQSLIKNRCSAIL